MVLGVAFHCKGSIQGQTRPIYLLVYIIMLGEDIKVGKMAGCASFKLLIGTIRVGTKEYPKVGHTRVIYFECEHVLLMLTVASICADSGWCRTGRELGLGCEEDSIHGP